MKRLLSFCFALAGAIGATTASSGAVDAVAIRHLVYRFTVGIQSTLTVHDSGIAILSEPGGPPGSPSGPGVNDLHAGSSDEGTITVDVTQQAADGGLGGDISDAAK